MTVAELYREGINMLKAASVDDSEFDCGCLFEHITGYNKTQCLLNAESDIAEDIGKAFIEAVLRRIDGEPLQYILGKWEFMGLDFSVGEGVLIPRPETELLVEKACVYLKDNKNAVVYDLCAGSGAIGLTVAKLNPDCRVYLFEKYDKAFRFLEENAQAFSLDNARIYKYDIFDGFNNSFDKPDLIISNPPYIISSEIPFLQREVLREPVSALDGGADGLDFYRCFKEKWYPYINSGGRLLSECSDGQSGDILSLFSDISSDMKVYLDFNDIDRIVEINV